MIIVGTATSPPVVEPPGEPLPVVPEPSVAPLSWRWTTADGKAWELTSWGSPIIKTKGATGAGQAPVEHWWQDSPMVPGSAWDGHRVGRGSLFLPLLLRAGSSLEFLTLHREFMAALAPDVESVFRVTAPDGSWREARGRYSTGADLTLDIDPVKMRSARYGITWELGVPFWLGEPVVAEFVYDAGAAFFPGPPFTLAPGQVLGSAAITNPGDVEAFPVWRMNGPFTGFTVGVGASVVSATLTKSAGQWVEVDMDPRALTVLDEAGVDCWSSLTEATFEGIPTGDTSLTTQLDDAGAGSGVRLSFTPRYRSAW